MPGLTSGSLVNSEPVRAGIPLPEPPDGSATPTVSLTGWVTEDGREPRPHAVQTSRLPTSRAKDAQPLTCSDIDATAGYRRSAPHAIAQFCKRLQPLCSSRSSKRGCYFDGSGGVSTIHGQTCMTFLVLLFLTTVIFIGPSPSSPPQGSVVQPASQRVRRGAYRKSSMTTSTSHGRTGLLVVFRVSSVFFFPFIRSSNNP